MKMLAPKFYIVIIVATAIVWQLASCKVQQSLIKTGPLDKPLYLDCGNFLTFDIPSQGDQYSPVFSSTTGDAIRSREKGTVVLMPDSEKMKGKKKADLTITSMGYSETLYFDVMAAPLPEIVLNLPAGNERADAFRCESDIATLRLDVVPEQAFAKSMPRDARYKVTGLEVQLVRDGQVLFRDGPRFIRKIKMDTICAQAKAGDQIVLMAKKVERLSLKGKRHVIDMPGKTFRLTVQ